MFSAVVRIFVVIFGAAVSIFVAILSAGVTILVVVFRAAERIFDAIFNALTFFLQETVLQNGLIVAARCILSILSVTRG